jgi:hypothetical protein
LAELAALHQKAIASRGHAGEQHAIAETEFATKGSDKGLVVEEAVGAGLDAEAVTLDGGDGAADAGVALEDEDLGGRKTLFETIGEGEAGDAAADDEDAGHGRRLDRI